MHYLISLKGGRFLVEDEGVVKIVKASLPYPDCEYKGVRGSENIFERLGLSYTFSGHKEDAIQKVLAGREEMSIKTFITEAKKFTEKNNKYKAYIEEKKQAKLNAERVEKEKRETEKAKGYLVKSLCRYFDFDAVNTLLNNLGYDLDVVSQEEDVFLMLGVEHKREVTFEQIKEIAHAFYNLSPSMEGSFSFFKDVFSSGMGKYPCIILYSLKDDFDVDDLFLNPFILESIYEVNYDWDFTNCEVEDFAHGQKVTFTYEEGNKYYREYEDNIFLQYIEYKEI